MNQSVGSSLKKVSRLILDKVALPSTHQSSRVKFASVSILATRFSPTARDPPWWYSCPQVKFGLDVFFPWWTMAMRRARRVLKWMRWSRRYPSCYWHRSRWHLRHTGFQYRRLWSEPGRERPRMLRCLDIYFSSCCQLYRIHVAIYRLLLMLLLSAAEQDYSVQGLQILKFRLVLSHDKSTIQNKPTLLSKRHPLPYK